MKMGNRAVIALGNKQDAKIGIYLHWNGGRDSVEGFLDATRELMKDPGPDAQYASARLIQVIGNFFGGTTSLGLDLLENLDCDNGDNGVYFVDPESLVITGREFAREEQSDTKHREGVKQKAIEKNRVHFLKQTA
jgi:hypothetical protein